MIYCVASALKAKKTTDRAAERTADGRMMTADLKLCLWKARSGIDASESEAEGRKL